MNIKLLVVVGILFVCSLILIFCGKKTSKEVEITYKISAGIPFKTVYEIEDKSIVQFVNSYVFKDENTGAKVGAPIYTNYVFKGLKEGSTTITFKSVSINNSDDYFNKETYKVKVDNDNNISIVMDNE